MRKNSVLILVFIFMIVATPITIFSEGSIFFSEEEQAFIDNHPVIKLGIDPKFVPFEFIDNNGVYSGISSDYLTIISEKTGLTFEIAEDLSWVEAYDLALEGKLDALPAVSRTLDREQHFLFSDPYYNYQRVIVTRTDESEIKGLDDLEGFTVALQKNSSHESYLVSYPNINLSLYESVEAAITAVANGSERVFVGNLASTSYIIQNSALTNLKFIAFDSDKQLGIHFAVRNDWPELVSIINKVIDSLSEQERIAINSKWVSIDSTYDFGPILQSSLIILVILGLVIGVSFYWIARLQQEVEKRQKIQKALERAKEEAVEANEFKSSFMARMSHEIRTPLHAITGVSHLIKKTSLSITQKMYVDRIMQASNNMLSIVNDILDYSKIEAGKVELEIGSFSLDQSIQNIVNIVSYKIEAQEIAFNFTKDPNLANWYIGDQKRIEQILLNLLNNAVKFTSKGEVSFDISLVEKNDEIYTLKFTINDTGIGMTSDQVEKLFTPFTQGDSSINRRFGGSGLGLSIVKNLSEMMDGDVEVHSVENRGTTFTVVLPLKVDVQKEANEIKNLVGDDLKNMRTLIVEKTGTSMSLIESYLGSFKMSCELTNSLTQAINLLEATEGEFSKTVDLLIIDYNAITELDLNTIKRIKSNEEIGNKLKIILLLPMLREDLLDKLENYNIDVGIVKPIIPSVLLNCIVDLFELKAVFTVQEEKSNDQDTSIKALVLLVEDNQTNQLIAKTILEQAGYEVVTAINGEKAVEQFNKHKERIDVVLMDLHMPIMNGYEAAVKIREISSDIPIVAMSADVIMGIKEKCEQSGMHYYISKPFNPNQLIKMIEALVKESKDSLEYSDSDDVLNREIGYHNVGEDVAFYKIVLQEFYNENRNSLEQLNKLLDDNNISEAAQIVHKIKGSSGSIGATKLYKVSIEFQKALKDEAENEISRIKEAYLSQLEKLIKRIEEELKQ